MGTISFTSESACTLSVFFQSPKIVPDISRTLSPSTIPKVMLSFTLNRANLTTLSVAGLSSALAIGEVKGDSKPGKT